MKAKREPPFWLRAIIGRNPVVTLIRCVVLVVVVFTVFKVILAPVRIYGPSMEPTFRQGKISLINRLAYRSQGPQRGDIIGLKTSGEHVLYMKRVIGLPGEQVEIRDNVVWINGEPLDEPYTMTGDFFWNEPPIQLESGEQAQYYCMGDNRTMSQDEHDFGAYDQSRIFGKVVW